MRSTALMLAACLAACAAAPATTVVLAPVDGPLGVSAQQVHWAGPPPTGVAARDVLGVPSATQDVALEGRRAAPGDLVLLPGRRGDVTGSGVQLVPDRFGDAPTGAVTVRYDDPCAGRVASRWEVTDVADGVATLRLLDAVQLCDG